MKNDIVDKIRNLLQRTKEKGASEAEVETAAKLAAKLMEKHQIDQAEVFEHNQSSLGIEDYCEMVMRDHCKWERWEKRLGSLAAESTNTKYYMRKSPGITKTGKLRLRYQFVAYGHRDDVQAACAMFAEMLTVCRTMAITRLGPWKQQHYHYCEGFCTELIFKLREERRAAEEERNKNTRTLVVRKDELLRQYAAEKLNLKDSRSGKADKSQHGDAYRQGLTDGKNFSTTTGRKVTGGAKRLG